MIRKAFACIVLIFLLLFLPSPEESAANLDITTEALSPEIRDAHIETYSTCIEPLPREPYHTPINRFDVNENGYALCCSGSSNKGNEILVYDHDGVFLYGFTVDLSCAFHITREENDVVLYLYRSYLALTVDETGTITDVRSIQDDHDNMRRLDRMQNVRSIPLDGFTYEVRKDSGVQLLPGYAYNKLVRTDQNGQELVLYDATGDAQRRLLFVGITVPLLIGSTLFIIIRSLVQMRHQALPTSNNELEEDP